MTTEDRPGFWNRLRRRKVVQWGIAYAAGAWGLLQGLAYASSIFHWPEYLQPLMALALLVGLPVVLVIAWYHGDQGRQRVTGPEFAIISLLFLLGGAMFWHYEHSVPTGAGAGPAAGVTNGTGATKGAAVAGDAPRNSIAVLPFVNISGDPANEYFSDGVSEEILNVLAQTPGLRVAARTSSFSFKGKAVEVPEIARELGVRMVLEGSVRKQGGTVRVTAQLTDAEAGFNVWSETYDRSLRDVFAIQDEIAGSIAGKMKVRLIGTGAPVPSREPTVSPEAHDHYLRGLALWQRRREAELWQAIDEFDRAIAIDPKYAQAYAGLALDYAVIAGYSTRINDEAAGDRATVAAHMALGLDPALPEAFAALGQVAVNQHRQTVGRVLLERAIALRPSFATAYHWIGAALATGGDPASGLIWLDRAAALDPRSLVIAGNQTYVLGAIGRYDRAPAACLRVLKFAPEFSPCLVNVGLIHVMSGDHEAARPYFLEAARVANPSAVPLVNQIIDALVGRGDKHRTALRLAGYPPRSYSKPGSGTIFAGDDTVPLLMALGAPELALDYIDRYSREPETNLNWALPVSTLDPIRCDPRFQAAARLQSVNDVRAAKLCATPKTST